jgi:hypothetical protein
MTETQRRGLARVAAVVALTFAAVYLFQLGSLALATRQARRLEAEQRMDVARLATQVAALETATNRAASDEHVEAWARDHRNWARPGDHVLVPVAATPTPASGGAPAPEGPNPLQQLWDWLRKR